MPERPLLIDGALELGSAGPFVILNPTTSAPIDSVDASAFNQIDTAVLENLDAHLGGSRSSGEVRGPGLGETEAVTARRQGRSDWKLCQRGSGPTAIDAGKS